MKSAGKKTMHRLIIDDVSDHQFFGIVTPEADYKISLKLNQALSIRLKSDNPISPGNDSGIDYSRFTSISDFNEITYQLVSNKSNNLSLSSSFPSLDYLFVICGSENEDMIKETRKKILDIREVTAVFLLGKEQMVYEYSLLQLT